MGICLCGCLSVCICVCIVMYSLQIDQANAGIYYNLIFVVHHAFSFHFFFFLGINAHFHKLHHDVLLTLYLNTIDSIDLKTVHIDVLQMNRNKFGKKRNKKQMI